MSTVPFLISLLVTGLFVFGSWKMVCAFGCAGKGNAAGAMMNFVVGLGLKFPAAIYLLKIFNSPNSSDRTGAIVAICLVYFSSVVGMAIHGFRQNSKN
jgi:hypothetical protein